MASSDTIILRAESKPLEHRSVLSPSAVACLVAAGYTVKCEKCTQRCFTDEEMAKAGAMLIPTNSWRTAPLDNIIVGLKELPPSDDFPLEHTHLHFAHVYKNQPGWQHVLSRFERGNGTLLDFEFLPDPNAKSRLLNPTSFHAGFCGAVLALKGWSLQTGNTVDLSSVEAGHYNSEADAIDDIGVYMKRAYAIRGRLPIVMVVGASGKCGTGAIALCQRLDLPPQNIVQCGRAETASPDFTSRALGADILLNCIYLSEGTTQFISKEALEDPNRHLSVVSDVSCDGDDASNPIAIYSGHTSFRQPYMNIPTVNGPPMTVIAIDHLPSLIPRAASEYCAEQLLPSLLHLRYWQKSDQWELARQLFQEKKKKAREINPRSRSGKCG